MSRVLLLTALAALLLAACSGEAGPEDDAGATGDGPITVVMDDMFFEPDSIEVPAGETVTIELVNEGSIDHDLVFDESTESEPVPAGETRTMEIGPFDSDTVGWCSVPGHRDAGMELEVTVTG